MTHYKRSIKLEFKKSADISLIFIIVDIVTKYIIP